MGEGGSPASGIRRGFREDEGIAGIAESRAAV